MTSHDSSAAPRLERAAAPAAGTELLELAGELDLAVSARFHQLVDEVLASRPALVVADVSEVAFVDSTMLRELLRAHREVSESGGRLVLVAPQSAFRRLLDLTGTADVFAVADSRDAALASRS